MTYTCSALPNALKLGADVPELGADVAGLGADAEASVAVSEPMTIPVHIRVSSVRQRILNGVLVMLLSPSLPAHTFVSNLLEPPFPAMLAKSSGNVTNNSGGSDLFRRLASRAQWRCRPALPAA